jgi:hypothetical protein
LNPRHPAPKAGALPRLSYTPTIAYIITAEDIISMTPWAEDP